MLIALTTVWVVGLLVSYADARLPPKFLKATNNVGKIYSGPYSYSIVPVAPKFIVQASLARKEVHVPVLRPVRSKRRPFSRRPPPTADYGSGGFQDYSPQPAASKNHPRLRKPPKQRRKPRPPTRDSDYYEQEVEDEVEDFNDYEYEEKHQSKVFDDRPKKRDYSSSTPKTYEYKRPKGPHGGSRHHGRFEDDDEFIAQHSELYSSGFPPSKPKSRPPRFRDHDPEDGIGHYGPPKKQKPSSKGYKGPSRPSSKLYSAAVPPVRRPQYPREDDRYRFDHDEDEETPTRLRYKKRPKHSDDESYDDSPHHKDISKHFENDKDTDYRNGGPITHEEYEYSSDTLYHDRKFEPKQKSKRGTEDKETNAGAKPRPRTQKRPVDSEEDQDQDEDEHSGVPNQWKNEKPKTKSGKRDDPKDTSDKATKWSIPFRLEENDEEVHDKGRPSSDSDHQSRPTKEHEKPVSELETPHSSWPVIVQGLNWRDAPHPPFSSNPSAEYLNNWQDFHVPQWPTLDEQLGKFPESLRSTFKWVEPTNQTPLHPTPTLQHHDTQPIPAVVSPPEDYLTRLATQGSSGRTESRKKKTSKRSKIQQRQVDSEIVAQRVVGGTLQLNGGFKPDSSPAESWVNPEFQAALKSPGRTPQKQYSVETFKSIEPASKIDPDVVYGTRIPDSKSKQIEPDIGYHSGMETMEDDLGGWQVY